MDILIDTNVLLYMAYAPARLTPTVAHILEDTDKTLWYSAASIWEVVIKSRLNQPGFIVDPEQFRMGLFEAGLFELPINGEHLLEVSNLPESVSEDPFDRLIVAQSHYNRLPLLTGDDKLINSVGDYITVIPNG